MRIHINFTNCLTAVARMLDIEDFEVVFRGNSYSRELIQDINRNKAKLSNRKSFFERLLELLQIKCKLSDAQF